MIDPGEDSVGSEYEGSCVHRGGITMRLVFFFLFFVCFGSVGADRLVL